LAIRPRRTDRTDERRAWQRRAARTSGVDAELRIRAADNTFGVRVHADEADTPVRPATKNEMSGQTERRRV
jgi:hypothetical protein